MPPACTPYSKSIAVAVVAGCLGVVCVAAGARNLLQPRIDWPFAVATLGAAALLLRVTARQAATKDVAILFLGLCIAGLTWAGVLRFRQSSAPGSSTLSITSNITPQGLGRFLLYGTQMTLAWWKRRFER